MSLTAGDAVAAAEITYTTAAADGGVNEWRDIDVTPSVLFWATNGGPNYGWALIDSGDDGYQCASSEATDQTLRPQLLITFTPSAETNALVIVTQPAATNIINESQNVTLSVVVTGTQPSYQWYKNDAEITGATGPSYTITGAVEADAGKYYCRISNLAGSVQSDDSWLIVIADHTAPTVLSAQGGPAANTTVVVTFSEAMATGPGRDALELRGGWPRQSHGGQRGGQWQHSHTHAERTSPGGGDLPPDCARPDGRRDHAQHARAEPDHGSDRHGDRTGVDQRPRVEVSPTDGFG